MRHLFVALCMVFLSTTSSFAQVSVSIGINVPAYPDLVRVPDYPVYYAPRMNANFFFYDGMYWVYERDNWYASSWYNGPWDFVAPDVVPLFVLRIPVRYYRNPPAYFRGWQRNAPPRWGEHWGNDWRQHRSGWDRWDRRSAPRPAPLPVYQRKYTGDRYPQAERQQDMHSRQYRYQPRDAQVRQHNQERSRRPQDGQRVTSLPPRREAAPVAPAAPRAQSPQPGGAYEQRSEPRRHDPRQVPERQAGPNTQEHQQASRQGEAQRERQAPAARQESAGQGRGASTPEQERGPRQEKQRESGEERNPGRNR